MDRNRLMMIGAALAALVVVAGGFLLGVQPQLKAASDAHATETSVIAQNAQLETSLASLKKQYDEMDDLKDSLKKLQDTVPDDVNTGSFITELNGIATTSDATLSNIQFGTASAYVPPVSTTATPTDTASASASPSASATAAPTPTATTPAAPTVATSSLITASNFTTIPVTVSVQGTYAQALAFLQGLRDGDRLFLINSITSAASTSDASTDSTASSMSSTDTISWTFGGLVYALTDAQSATQPQQSTASSAADAASDGSATDTAAGQ